LVSIEEYFVKAIISWIISAYIVKLYLIKLIGKFKISSYKTIRFVIAFFLIFNFLFLDKSIVLIHFINSLVIAVYLILSRLSLKYIVGRIRKKGGNFKNILIFFKYNNSLITKQISLLKYDVLRIYHANDFDTFFETIHNKKINLVIIDKNLDNEDIYKAQKEAEYQFIDVELFDEKLIEIFRMGFKSQIDYTLSFPLIQIIDEPLKSVENRIIKRVFDLIISIPIAIFILPLVFVILFPLHKLFIGSSFFFIQKRIGLKGKKFNVIKIRTMKPNPHENNSETKNDDERLSMFGYALRKMKLDELPQIINVIKGEMSIIGPRPYPIFFQDKYANVADHYNLRYKVKPGITGLAQIKGYHGPTENLNNLKSRLKFDLFYVKNWSLDLDLMIILATIINSFKLFPEKRR
jgi:lipopolysaccharide/colanic/teichoic acid biosynthesis glycosyltransferase